MGARARLWRRVLIAVSIAAAGAKALALGTAWAEPIASDRTGGQPPSRSLPAQPQLGQALLTTIQIWLSTQFGLPVAQSQPRIELIPAAKIAAMRYRGLNPDSATHAAPGADVRGPEANVVASIPTPPARSIWRMNGLAVRRRSFLFSCMKWFIICRT
jgi:hypothetical protein